MTIAHWELPMPKPCVWPLRSKSPVWAMPTAATSPSITVNVVPVIFAS